MNCGFRTSSNKRKNLRLVEEAKNLGLIMDNTFRYRKHIDKCLKSAYANLRMLYPHRSYLPVNVKLQLSQSLVLSQFNYCSQIFFPCLDSDTLYKIQKVQNTCLRYAYGIRKYDRVSHKLKDAGWLNMRDRFRLLQACCFHKIMLSRLPGYLYNGITFRTDVHNINIRRKDAISLPKYKLSVFERSFTFNIYKVYSELPVHIKGLNPKSFKRAIYKSYFKA